MVRLRRGFFSRGVLPSASDSLLMLSGVWLGDGSEARWCCGESKGRCEEAEPQEMEPGGRWGGCRVMTERRG